MTDTQGWSKRTSKDRLDSPTRRRILDAAEAMFSARGFKATPISIIVERAGISRATFYVYFSSREEVLRALAARFRDEVSAVQRTASRLGSSPNEIIDSSIRAALRTYARHAPLLAVIEHQSLTDPAVEEMWREIRVRSEEVDTAFITALIGDGTADPATTPSAIAELIGAGLVRFAHGSLHRDHDPVRSEDELINMYRRLIGFPSRSGSRSHSPGRNETSETRSAATERTRLRILDAAERELARRGYDGTSMVDIASAAQVSRPTLYTYFGTKYAVLQGVCERVRDTFLAAQERAGHDAREVITVAARTYFTGWVRHYGILTVIEHQAMTDPEFAQLLDDLQGRLHRRHSAYLDRLRADAQAAPLIDATKLAEAFTGAVRQLAQAVRAGRASEPQAARDAEQLLLTLTNLTDNDAP